jgi:lipopolysaccharide transport protein LptA
MRIRSLARQHYRLLAAAGLLVLIAAIFFSMRYGKGGDRRQDGGPSIDGRNLTYFDFDTNNRKSLAIQCQESRRLSNERLLMKTITATFFKSAKLEKDIQVSGDAGIASRSFYDFDIRGRVRIFSSEFSFDGPRFFLENREKLSSRDPVTFKLKNVSGQAAAGMEYYINLSVLKLFQCRGTMIRDGQPYDFQAQTFWVIKKDNVMVLEKKSELTGAGATARGDWMSLKFDPGFVHLQSVTSVGNCFFSMVEKGENGRPQSKEITSDLILIDYDALGRLRQITVHGAGKISLQDQKNKCQIAAEVTKIFLRSETQTLDNVQTLTRGTLSSHGRDNITVSGDLLSAFYSKDGLLVEMKAKKNCEFRTDEFRGTAEALNYDAPLFLFDIAGRDANIVNKRNSFTSNHFQIHSKPQQLQAEKAVKATIMPGGKSVLLSSRPLFIVADAMEMTHRGDLIRFKDKVKLFQDEVELHAGEMLFDNTSNRMTCHGDVELKFGSENGPVELRGQTIVFNHAESRAVISGNASLNQAGNVLGGRQIELDFDRGNQLESILARDNAVFSRENLSARSGSLHWQYRKKVIWFRNAAQITRKDAGTTKGQELILNLDSNEITVSSREDRAETVIRPDRP